jgi:formamidopyrimidine-DNA glycosylase
MPELPEVEVLVRHLDPLLENQIIQSVTVQRAKILAPTPLEFFLSRLKQCRFSGLNRRGKYLLFNLQPPAPQPPFQMLGHLGMTGRLFLVPRGTPPPKHAAVVFHLRQHDLVFEDTRYFGRMTLDTTAIAKLGPEPWAGEFTEEYFAQRLKTRSQAIKILLLDQNIVAGVGNIYASEALHRAGLSPRKMGRRLNRPQVAKLLGSIQSILAEAIAFGSTVPLNWSSPDRSDKLFYYGKAPDAADFFEERLAVYDRQGLACRTCASKIRKIVQAARSTFFCPRCQK